MKILFLCTSLAPGRDGVGDYVRQLAAACTEAGHVCLLVALNDRNLAPSAAMLHRSDEVRLSAAMSWSRRAAMLAGLARDFDPQWVSWQMVSYGFHPKGILPAGMFGFIDAVRRWPNQVMLHELWVGLARGEPLRLRVVGALQRRRLLSFLRRLSPACIHTTNPAYQMALAYDGWPSELLPLFGNMPVLPVKRYLAEAELLDVTGTAFPAGPRWVGVIFGTLHPQWRPGPTMEWLRAAAAESGRPVCLVSIGRAGAHGTQLLAQLGRDYPDIRICVGGAQSPEKISHLLQACDFGLTTHAWGLIEKSGTAATLLEHGLPVLVPRNDWIPRHGSLEAVRDPLLRRLDDLPPAGFPRWLQERREPAARLPGIAAKFISQLSGPIPRGALVA